VKAQLEAIVKASALAAMLACGKCDRDDVEAGCAQQRACAIAEDPSVCRASCSMLADEWQRQCQSVEYSDEVQREQIEAVKRDRERSEEEARSGAWRPENIERRRREQAMEECVRYGGDFKRCAEQAR
jgi:hypothetical protein